MNKRHGTASTVLTERDSQRLSALAAKHDGYADEVGRMLAQELENARIVEPEKISPDVVTMNSTVEVRDEATGRTQVFTLVYPGDENISLGRLSILTPAGAALIGLRKGEILTWITRDGQTKELSVVDILYQPEANGRFDL